MEEKTTTTTTTVTHACGHTPSANALLKGIRAVVSSKCGGCEYKMPNTLAAIASRQAKLPALVGSECQTAWATTIRVEKLAQIETVLTRLRSHILAQTEASWWIAREDMTGLDLVANEFLAQTPRIAASLLPPVLNKPKEEATTEGKRDEHL